MHDGWKVVRIQLVDFAPLGMGLGKTLMAKEGWIHESLKPREVERRENSSKPIELETLRQKYNFIEFLSTEKLARTCLAILPFEV